MGRPTKVDIGPYRFDIVFQDYPIIDQEKRSCTGLFSPETQTIYIKDNGRGLQRIQQSLIHELLHSFHFDRSFEPGECNHIVNCDEFGKSFLLFVKRNHSVIEWLMTNLDCEHELVDIKEMPSLVNVGPYQYTLRARPSIIKESHSVIVATNAKRLQIEYCPNRGVNMIQASLLMEIMGAIFDCRNFDPGTSADTELIVDELATGLLLFIKQNRDFISWLINN